MKLRRTKYVQAEIDIEFLQRSPGCNGFWIRRQMQDNIGVGKVLCPVLAVTRQIGRDHITALAGVVAYPCNPAFSLAQGLNGLFAEVTCRSGHDDMRPL